MRVRWSFTPSHKTFPVASAARTLSETIRTWHVAPATHPSAHTPRKQAMAQDGSQPPAWTGQAFPFLPKLVAGEFLAWRAGAQKSC